MSALLDRLRKQQAAKLEAMAAPKTVTVDSLGKTAETQVVGVVKESASPVTAMAKAKALLSTAEQQYAADSAAGLFDISTEGSEIDGEKFILQFKELRQAMLAKTPDLPKLQLEIANNLRQYTELCYLLTDAQLGVIVSASMEVAEHKQIIGQAKKPTKKAVETLVSSLSLDDF